MSRSIRLFVMVMIAIVIVTATWFRQHQTSLGAQLTTLQQISKINIGKVRSPIFDIERFRIGPVDGLTSIWHTAPETTMIPLGVTASFGQLIPPGCKVKWKGIEAVEQIRNFSIAQLYLCRIGRHEITVQIVDADLNVLGTNTCFLEVVDRRIGEIRVSVSPPQIEPIALSEDSSNEETMTYFCGEESIAALREVGPDRYRTSTHRTLYLEVAVDPPGFEPLMEWRVNGQATRLGPSISKSFDEMGLHTISVGPVDHLQSVTEFEIYKVEIISTQPLADSLPEGTPVTFRAVTDPPGYENNITWLSSTEYGIAAPVLGYGPVFTAAQLDDSATGCDDRPWGVRADNARLGGGGSGFIRRVLGIPSLNAFFGGSDPRCRASFKCVNENFKRVAGFKCSHICLIQPGADCCECVRAHAENICSGKGGIQKFGCDESECQ